ncbi:MAG: aminoglycoside phosphotransferase family protein [Reyranella sp.]|nr:aminoglycoside phosphotransferase family protein [Reyranella sp.]
MAIEELRAAVVGAFPEHASSDFRLLAQGWDCVAVEVDGHQIFKFPRHDAARRRLAVEAGLLAQVRPAVTLPVPRLTLHGKQRLFSRHEKIAGEPLLTAQYEKLSEPDRQNLAAELALFYSQLHSLAMDDMKSAGAGPIEAWLPPQEILQRTWPVLSPDLRAYAERTVAAWQDLPADPQGMIYGFFDGHGWNMAFDHVRGRLNGLYDFGDSGFGALHQEFIYANWIAADLTERIMAGYESLTGRILDRERVTLLSGVLRLSELAQSAHDPAEATTLVRTVAAWVASAPQRAPGND